MKCENVRRYLSPYLDSELDETTTFEIARHLSDCGECAGLVRAEQGLEQTIREHLVAPCGDEREVLERALARIRKHDEGEVLRGEAGSSGSRGARHSIAVAASLALLVLALFGWRWIGSSRSVRHAPELLRAAASDHALHAAGSFEVAAPDRGSVPATGGDASDRPGKDPRVEVLQLAETLGLALEVPSLESPWVLTGARLCTLHGTRVGFVMMRYRDVPVSLYLVSPRDAAAFPEARRAAEEGHCFELGSSRGMVRCHGEGMLAVVADLSPSLLEQLLSDLL